MDMNREIRDSPSTPERNRYHERARERESRLMTSPTQRRERQAAAAAQRMQNPAQPPPQPFQHLLTNAASPSGVLVQQTGVRTSGMHQNEPCCFVVAKK